MEITLTSHGYRSTNFYDAKNEKWHYVNYIITTGDNSIQHYDGWAVYHQDESDKIFQWCSEQLDNNWAYSGGEFYFKDERDAMLFLMRWCYA